MQIPYKVEGIGYDFIPKTCGRETADIWLKSNDQESFTYARKLIKEEGLLVGGSSGACLWGAMNIARGLPKDKRVVCIFTDSIRNYLTKFVNDDWCLESGFLSQETYDKKYIENPECSLFGGEEKVGKICNKKVESVSIEMKVKECLKKFEELRVDYVRQF